MLIFDEIETNVKPFKFKKQYRRRHKYSEGGVMRKKTQIELPIDEITSFCRKHHIRKLSLFGSVLRDDFGSGSDIDILVEFEPGKVPSFFRLFDMEDALSAMLGGRKVDLRTPEDLSRYFRDKVLATAVVQYAA